MAELWAAWGSRLCAMALLWAVWGAQAQEVNFQWRAADLQRQQQALAAPRAMFEAALARHEQAKRRGATEEQLTALLDAASAAVWLGPAQGDEMLAAIPKSIGAADMQQATHRELLVDLYTNQALILTAAYRLDDAQRALSRADALMPQVADAGHRASMELARALQMLLRDDAEQALRHLDDAYEYAVHDVMRGLIQAWQASVYRRASYYKHELVRLSWLKGRDAERLVPPDAFPLLGMLNISVLSQTETVLGEMHEATRHGRLFLKLAARVADENGLSYNESGMIRILSQFRRQDFTLAEKLGRRRVLLTWGLLAAAILAAGAMTAVVVLSRQRRTLAQASAELELRNSQLQALHRSHTRLLAASCHDLREPAHALALLADTAAASAERDRTDGAARDSQAIDEHLASIRFCSMRLTDMLSELLDLTRIESGHYVPERVPVALHPVFDEAGLYLQELARRRGITLEIAMSDLHVRTDPYLLRRIILSLVATALRTTQAGVVRVSAHLDRQGRVQLKVQDSSAGMAPEVLSSMLDRGTDLSLVTSSAQGLELGVSIVKRAAELLEVPVEVSSQSGRGNVVRLTLEHAPAPAAQVARSTAKPGNATGRPCVAVLEDDLESRQGMSALLEHWGYQVITAADATSLTAVAQASGHSRPDLLITDLHLGAANGLQEAAAVRAWSGEADLPVVLLTGDQDEQVARQASSAGVLLNYKPLLPRQLRASVQAALQQRRLAPPQGHEVRA